MDAAHTAEAGIFSGGVASATPPIFCAGGRVNLDKPSLRRQLIDARSSRPAERFGGAAPLPLLVGLRLVASYVAMPTEPDPTALLPDGVTACLPLLPAAGRVLRFARAGGVLVPATRGGFLEPTGAELDPSTIDAFLVPGLAFTRSGGRLGRGGGFYDATLAAFPRALRIGLCAREELLDELPLLPHDMRVDAVLAGDELVTVLPRRPR